MSAVTQCPICNTCFKVSQEQLDARNGLVRCGSCQAIFNAREHLRETQPSPQLELPIMEQTSASAKPEENHEPRNAAAPGEIQEATQTEAEISAIKPSREDAQLTLAQQIAIAETSGHHPDTSKKKRKRAWPWAIGCLLLLAVMLAQAAYFLRVELAARIPVLKPALASYCGLLKCSIPLPRKIDLVSIESSDLEADPANASKITLHATLRNNASYALAYPAIELTFTDTQDKLLARRTFRPDEYLKPEENEMQGLASRREASIRLHLDTADLKPTGYRLFLYYP